MTGKPYHSALIFAALALCLPGREAISRNERPVAAPAAPGADHGVRGDARALGVGGVGPGGLIDPDGGVGLSDPSFGQQAFGGFLNPNHERLAGSDPRIGVPLANTVQEVRAALKGIPGASLRAPLEAIWKFMKDSGKAKEFLDEKGVLDFDKFANALCFSPNPEDLHQIAQAMSGLGIKLKRTQQNNAPATEPAASTTNPALASTGGSILLSPARRAGSASGTSAPRPAQDLFASPARPPGQISTPPIPPVDWSQAGCQEPNNFNNPNFNNDLNADDDDEGEEGNPMAGSGGGGPEESQPPQPPGGSGGQYQPSAGGMKPGEMPPMGQVGGLPKIGAPDEASLLRQIAEAGRFNGGTDPQATVDAIAKFAMESSSAFQNRAPLSFGGRPRRTSQTQNAFQQFANSPSNARIKNSSRQRSPFQGLFK